MLTAVRSASTRPRRGALASGSPSPRGSGDASAQRPPGAVAGHTRHASPPVIVDDAQGMHRGPDPGEAPREASALAQDRRPRQPRLEALEAELLEEAHIVAHRSPPLGVVVVDVLGR